MDLLAELAERQRVALGLTAGIEAVAAIGGEGAGEVEQGEVADGNAFVRDRGGTEVGDDVAEAFGAEGFEAFRHQRGLIAGAGSDVRDLHFDGHAAGLLQLHDDGVLAADERAILSAVLQLDDPGAVLVVDHAIRVNDVHEELGGRVRADALQVRAEVVADLADHVAGLAGADEEFLALGDVAGLLDVGTELGDDLVLGAMVTGVELGKDRGGALRDSVVRVTGQLGGLERPKLHRRQRLGFQSVEHQTRPLRTGHERGVSDLPDGRFTLEEGGEQGLAGLGVTGGGQGLDGGEGHEVRRALLEELRDGREDSDVDAADGDERAGGRSADVRRSLLVGDERQELLRGGRKLGLEVVSLGPSRGEGDGGEAELGVAVGDGLLQSGHGGGLIGRSGGIAGSEDLQGGASDGDVAGRSGGLHHAETGDAVVRGGQARGERTGELDVGRFGRSHLRLEESRGIGSRGG